MSSVHTRQYQQFLVKLKAARLEAGVTQREVARLMRKPQSWVSKCESGERRVDIIELTRFARVYRQSIEFFLPPRSKNS